jgi:hypothetical protein
MSLELLGSIVRGWQQQKCVHITCTTLLHLIFMAGPRQCMRKHFQLLLYFSQRKIKPRSNEHESSATHVWAPTLINSHQLWIGSNEFSPRARGNIQSTHMQLLFSFDRGTWELKKLSYKLSILVWPQHLVFIREYSISTHLGLHFLFTRT